MINEDLRIQKGGNQSHCKSRKNKMGCVDLKRLRRIRGDSIMGEECSALGQNVRIGP